MNLKYFENIDLSNVLIVRMKSMDDIRTKLLEVMSKNRFKRAVILSAIGSVYDAIFCRDYPLLMGIFLITAISVVAAALITDLVYTVLDPRVRL